MRPLLQDFVLRPDVFVGGPAEVAYYAQAAPLHPLLNVPMPRVALRAHANGSYVSADRGGAAALIANRVAIGPWETFLLVQNQDGSVSLKADANGRYVTPDNGGAWPLIANRDALGAWEEFDLVR